MSDLEKRACGHEHHPKDGPCGKLSQIPQGEPEARAPRRSGSSALALLLGMAAAVQPEPLARPRRISGQEQCTACGVIEGHHPDCQPPRAFRKV